MQHSCGSGMSTCASERAALGGSGGGGGCGRRLVPLRCALQQVVQAPKAARQIAQETLLPRAVLGRQAHTAHVGRGVSGRVTAGVAQRLIRMGALGVTNVGKIERRSCSHCITSHKLTIAFFLLIDLRDTLCRPPSRKQLR